MLGMNALLLFDTVYGNTEKIAQAIAEGLQPAVHVRFTRADQIARLDAEGNDLLIVGGPTHRQRMSKTLRTVLEATPHGTLKGVKVAAFDTRYRMSAWLSGSAARDIAGYLRKLGGQLVAPPESFFMERDVPPRGEKRRHQMEQLEPGELERTAQWAAEIVRVCQAA
jgi:flavodoxin